MTDSIRHAGRWTLEERFASPWHYLPVEVPPGTGALRVELDYDRTDGAVLDLGCFGPGGFRGWSGGARESFVIARDAATPGYLPGELEAGTWQVVIGVHRVPCVRRSRRPWRRPRRRLRRTGRRAGICRPGRAAAGWPATCTRTPCTRTAS